MTSSTLSKLKIAGIILLVIIFFIPNIIPYFLPSNSLYAALIQFVSIPLTMLLTLVAIVFFFIQSMGKNTARIDEMKKFGNKVNWEFQKEADLHFLREDAARLQLGEYIDYHPLNGKTNNLLSGKIHNVDGIIKYGELSEEDRTNYAENITSFEAMIFDQEIYQDVYEHGIKLESVFSNNNNRAGTKSKNQTMFLLKMPLPIRFPPFCVEPEGFWNKMHDLVDNRDVDFPDFPVFSHKYKFFGGFMEDEIREIFNEDVLRFYERQLPAFITIGHEDRLLIYTPESVSDLNKIDSNITFLIKLASHFVNSKNKNAN